jgi:hypothetical protein
MSVAELWQISGTGSPARMAGKDGRAPGTFG